MSAFEECGVLSAFCSGFVPFLLNIFPGSSYLHVHVFIIQVFFEIDTLGLDVDVNRQFDEFRAAPKTKIEISLIV